MSAPEAVEYHKARVNLEMVMDQVSKYTKLCRDSAWVETTVEDAQKAHRQTLKLMDNTMGIVQGMFAMLIDEMERLNNELHPDS